MSKIDEYIEDIDNMTFKQEDGIPVVDAFLMKRLLDVELRPYIEKYEKIEQVVLNKNNYSDNTPLCFSLIESIINGSGV